MAEQLDASSDEFGTPDYIFDPLNDEFGFTIDCCASKKNHKLPRYYTEKDNALVQDFSGERVFCNPPYSRGNVKAFFGLALWWTRSVLLDGAKHCGPMRASLMPAKLFVLLIPTYTERDWFHAHRQHFEERFFDHRIKFIGGGSGARGNHMLLVFRNKNWMWFGR